MAFVSTRSGNVDVWLLDVETGQVRPVTATSRNETHPLLAADGSRVVYAVGGEKEASIYGVAADGGVPEVICEECGLPLDWSRDEKSVLFWSDEPVRFFSLDLSSRRKTEVVAHPKHSIFRAQYSPDGEWIAFHIPMEPRRTPVFVARLLDGRAGAEKHWIAVTDGTGLDAFPLWSPDGGTLFFLSERDGFLCLWSQALDPATKRPRGAPSDVSGNLWLAAPEESK